MDRDQIISTTTLRIRIGFLMLCQGGAAFAALVNLTYHLQVAALIFGVVCGCITVNLYDTLNDWRIPS